MDKYGMSGRRTKGTNTAGESKLEHNDEPLVPGNRVHSWLTSKYRPMSFAITNSKNVIVKNWSVIQPQFWASIVINSTDVLYKDYYVNATQYNPEGEGAFLSWLQSGFILKERVESSELTTHQTLMDVIPTVVTTSLSVCTLLALLLQIQPWRND